MRKKMITVGICVVLTLALVSASFAEQGNAQEKISRTIWLLKTGENGVGFSSENSRNYGPESFCITDEGIVILDTLNKRVLTRDYNGKETVHELINVRYPKDIYYFDSFYYVFDSWGDYGCVQKYTRNFILLDEVKLPKEINADAFNSFYINENERLCIRGNDSSYAVLVEDSSAKLVRTGIEYIRKDDNNLTVATGKSSWSIVFGENEYVRYLLENNGNMYYQRVRMVPDCSVLAGEITIEAVDSMGTYLGAYAVEKNEKTALANRYFTVYGNKCYLMIVTEEETRVEEVYLSCYFKSDMDMIVQEALEYENRMEAQMETISASTTRTEATNRANSMLSTAWTLRLANATIPANMSNVVLPDYILTIKNNGELNNGQTKAMSGIPYCWGGFDSQYSCPTFSSLMNSNKVAGNVSSANGTLVTGTAGLDCSGYVCTVYGLSSKLNTSGLASNLNVVSSQNSLQAMDCLVKSGHHAVLFYLWVNQSEGKMVILEENNPADYDDKVAYRTKYISEYLNNGYVMRTGW
jgi:hypothetical protein